MPIAPGSSAKPSTPLLANLLLSSTKKMIFAVFDCACAEMGLYVSLLENPGSLYKMSEARYATLEAFIIRGLGERRSLGRRRLVSRK